MSDSPTPARCSSQFSNSEVSTSFGPGTNASEASPELSKQLGPVTTSPPVAGPRFVLALVERETVQLRGVLEGGIQRPVQSQQRVQAHQLHGAARRGPVGDDAESLRILGGSLLSLYEHGHSGRGEEVELG